MKKTLILILSIFFASTFLNPIAAQAVVSNSFDLNACITAINDPLYTRDTLATTLRNPNGTQRYANGDELQAAINNGSIYLYVANGPGLIFGGSGSRQDNPDLYCGDSNDNSVTNLDSNTSTRDHFFGGAGNDTVTNSWLSDFYGGPGNDSVGNLSENSYFNGGPGTDSVGSISSSTFDQGVDDSTPPTLSSAALNSSGTAITLTYNEALSATTAPTSAFTVLDAGSAVAVSSATASGSALTLALGSTINIGRVVTVSYSDPTAGDDANAIQDLVGNDAASLTSQSVTNNSTVKATQTNITITSSTSVSFGSDLSLTSTGGSTGGTFTYTVISGSCTIEGSTLTPTAAGSCVIRSSLAENDNYLAAQSADTTITIATSNVSASITLDAGTLIYRQVKVITATATVAGKVTFKVNGKRLPGCIKKSVSAPNSYIATCSYRPSTRGYIKISTTLNPTNNSYIGTTTTSERLFVGNRSGTR